MCHQATHLASIPEWTMAPMGLEWTDGAGDVHRTREILPAGPAYTLRHPHDPALRLLGF